MIDKDLDSFLLDSYTRQSLIKKEIGRVDFIPPMVHSDVKPDLKEAFVRLASLKHKVYVECPNKVGSPNMQRNILLAAQHFGKMAQAYLDAKLTEKVSMRTLTANLNSKLYGM